MDKQFIADIAALQSAVAEALATAQVLARIAAKENGTFKRYLASENQTLAAASRLLSAGVDFERPRGGERHQLRIAATELASFLDSLPNELVQPQPGDQEVLASFVVECEDLLGEVAALKRALAQA